MKFTGGYFDSGCSLEDGRGPKPTGGSAFPVTSIDGFADYGMTLRDWFAGQALAAIIAVTSAGQHQPEKKHGKGVVDSMALEAYAMADAMLAAREVEP